ncbi:LolA family protein [Hymenobacter bucti]|uniref:Outer membrane lipoprotein carrier protein LolA n=1 Tax=Hymenobacter bucti TaxID=1844114 RepID=A0ABW4QU42_9BACT
MTQKFSLLALAATLALPAAAQQDPKAGKILDAVSAKYTALKSFQAGFTQTLENPAAKLKQNINGEVTVSGQKYHLKANGQEVLNDGKNTWTYLKNENEVNVSESDPNNQDMSPTQMYSMYKKGYKYTYVKSLKDAGVASDLIELSPDSKTNDVFKVQLIVGTADKAIHSVKTFKKNGTRTTFTLKNFKPNVPVAASTFAFDKAQYPGVKVVDLR